MRRKSRRAGTGSGLTITQRDLMAVLKLHTQMLADLKQDVAAVRGDFRSHDHGDPYGAKEVRLSPSPGIVTGPAAPTAEKTHEAPLPEMPPIAQVQPKEGD